MIIRVLFKSCYELLVSLCFERIRAYKYSSLRTEIWFHISTFGSNVGLSLNLHTHTETLCFAPASYICPNGASISLCYEKVDETEGNSESEFYIRWITISCSCMHHLGSYFHSADIRWNSSEAWGEILRNNGIMKYKRSWKTIMFSSMAFFKLVYFLCFCHCYFMNATTW